MADYFFGVIECEGFLLCSAREQVPSLENSDDRESVCADSRRETFNTDSQDIQTSAFLLPRRTATSRYWNQSSLDCSL